MLAGSPLYPTIPTKDPDRAREFYEGVLGLSVIRNKGFEVIYRAGDVEVDIYESDSAGTAEHTLASFIVDDIESIVRGLQEGEWSSSSTTYLASRPWTVSRRWARIGPPGSGTPTGTCSTFRS